MNAIINYLCILVALVPIIIAVGGDHRLKISLGKTDINMDSLFNFTEMLNFTLIRTDIISALGNDSRSEQFLLFLTSSYAGSGDVRYVELSGPSDKRVYMLTNKGNSLMADVDNTLKKRLSLRQKDNPDWFSAKIIRWEDLFFLQTQLAAHNERTGQKPVDFLTLVGVINVFLLAG